MTLLYFLPIVFLLINWCINEFVCVFNEPQHHSVQSLEDFPLHHHIPRPSRVLQCQPMDLPKFLFYTIPKVSLCADNQTSSLFKFCHHRVLWCTKWYILIYTYTGRNVYTQTAYFVIVEPTHFDIRYKWNHIGISALTEEPPGGWWRRTCVVPPRVCWVSSMGAPRCMNWSAGTTPGTSPQPQQGA